MENYIYKLKKHPTPPLNTLALGLIGLFFHTVSTIVFLLPLWDILLHLPIYLHSGQLGKIFNEITYIFLLNLCVFFLPAVTLGNLFLKRVEEYENDKRS